MKIQLLTLIGAAFGLNLPEIPDLPDLVGFVENWVHGNFTAQTVEEPQVFLPTIAQIRAMTDQERSQRFHWFVCLFFGVFFGVTIVGTVIMVVGAELKALGSNLGHAHPLSKGAQLRLVMLSFGGTVSLSLAATLWSLQTGRLSKSLGLVWEVYLLMFCCAGASLLIQAVLAVAWLKAGDRFDATAFAMASFSSMAPFLSDQFDTLKDVIFGGLCLQSPHLFMNIVGVLSWSYLLAFHAWFFFLSATQAARDVPGANCFNELATNHLSVLLIAPKVQGEWSGSCWERLILPTIYKQVTKCKRHHLLIENVPQAFMSVLFLLVEGGSFFVAALNLVVPGVQIALTFLLFEPVRAAAIPALGKSFNRALYNGNAIAAKALWHEAELTDDRQLFKLILPYLNVFVEKMNCCRFMSRALEDLEHLSDQDLETLHRIAAVFAAEVVCDFGGRNMGTSGAKVLAEALQTSGTRHLNLENNDIGDEGGEALGASLKTNDSLHKLFLQANTIGDSGAQALADGLKRNSSLQCLVLEQNSIGARGGEALAESLESNDTLLQLTLRGNSIGSRGAQAIGQSLAWNCCLLVLDLHGCGVGDSGAEAVARGLWDNRSFFGCKLSTLFLGRNGIGDHGAKALAESLGWKCDLRELYLQANSIGDRGAEAVARSLRSKGRCLQKLDLEGNSITDRGAQAVAISLTRNRNLQWLKLCDNNIGDVGAEALVRDSRTLQELCLKNNSIGERGAKAMARWLPSNKGLTHLRVNGYLRDTFGTWPQALEAAARKIVWED